MTNKNTETTTENKAGNTAGKPFENPFGKPTGKPIEKPAGKTVGESAGKAADEPAAKSTGKGVGKAAAEPAAKRGKEPVGKPAARSDKKSAGKAAAEPAGKPAGKSARKSAGKTAGKPSGSPDGDARYQVVDYAYGAPVRVHVIVDDPVQFELHREQVLMHWHTELEIVGSYQGEAQHIIDGVAYHARPGKVLITNSCSLHRIVPDPGREEEAGGIRSVVLQINMDFVKQVFPDAEELYFIPEVQKDNEKLSDLIWQMIPYSDKGAPPKGYDYLHMMSLLYEIFYEISRDRIRHRPGENRPGYTQRQERIREAILYVEEHYTEPLTEAEIAEKLYFSKEYFARVFKKDTGMTFMEFLSAHRVAKAWEALVSTDRNIMDIALDCGFTDARGFINAFKKQYGDTPLKYRKKWQARESTGKSS